MGQSDRIPRTEAGRGFVTNWRSIVLAADVSALIRAIEDEAAAPPEPPRCPKCGVAWSDTGYYEDGQRCHDPAPPEPPHDCVAAEAEIERLTAGAAPVRLPSVEAEQLVRAIEKEKRRSVRYPEDIGHDMGMAHAQDIIRREFRASLHESTAPPEADDGNG